MRKRLRLVWLALVAPIDAVEVKSSKLLNAMNNVYVDEVERRVKRVTSFSWELLGVRIRHSDNVDIDDIETFLKNSPDIIKHLIMIIRQ